MPSRSDRGPLYEVRRSRIQGRGLFALRRIRRGTRIVEYTGERITYAEGDRRYDDDKMQRHHTFLFILDGRTLVDAAVGGNEARLINHSCDPNCETVIQDKEIWVEALRTIHPGEELSYDYKYERLPGYTKKDEVFYACRCGAPNCRGTILVPAKKPRRKKSPARASAKQRRPATTKQRRETPVKRKRTRRDTSR